MSQKRLEEWFEWVTLDTLPAFRAAAAVGDVNGVFAFVDALPFLADEEDEEEDGFLPALFLVVEAVASASPIITEGSR